LRAVAARFVRTDFENATAARNNCEQRTFVVSTFPKDRAIVKAFFAWASLVF
jgi:hypothetical protein